MDINAAIREFRKSLGWSQQRFATELGISIRAVVNYEQQRMPSPKSLASLEMLAREHHHPELAYEFTQALGHQLGLGRVARGPLRSDENMLRQAFDRCVIEHPDSKQAKRIITVLQPFVQQLEKEAAAVTPLLYRSRGAPVD